MAYWALKGPNPAKPFIQDWKEKEGKSGSVPIKTGSPPFQKTYLQGLAEVMPFSPGDTLYQYVTGKS